MTTEATVPNSRRNVILLAICQAVFMTATSAVGAMGVLVGDALADDKALSTLPLAFQFGAMMFATIPASMYMKKVGRQIGFITGTFIAMIGALIATYAIVSSNFWLFCFGLMFLGSFNAFSQYFRFAAADASDDNFRSRAISLVLAGGVIAAITGPNFALYTKDLIGTAMFAGTFAGLVGIYLTLFVVLLFIRIPKPGEEERSRTERKLSEIVCQPAFIVAVLGAVIGFAVMAFLMSVTPLVMSHHSFTFGDSAFVIQAHMIGMFLPSFFTGSLIARYGVTNIMICGAVMMASAILINVSGLEFLYFFSGLFLVGTGWNFLFIGGTTLLTTCYAPAEKAKVQGLNDFLVFGSVAIGVLMSGATYNAFGWTAINYGVLPLVLVTLGATIWLKYRTRPVAA